MAEDVKSAAIEAEPAQPVGTAPLPTRADRARHSAYRVRFVLVYFALAIVAGCAVGAFIVGIGSSSTPAAKPVKALAPSTTGEPGATELAYNVQRTYRRASGDALVDVVATRNTLQDGNLGLLRVRFQVVQPFDALRDDSRILRPSNAIQYSLCGTSASCAIPGTASIARGALLRREALELALRTFLNDASVDNVAVFLRPVSPPQGFEGYVLMFNRSAVQRNHPELLARPIMETLPGAGSKITPAQITPAMANTVDELTKPYLYLYRYQLIGGHDALMELQPPPGA